MLLIFRPDLSLSDDTIPRSFRKRNFQISASGTANTWKRVETANRVVEPFKIGNRLLTYVSYAREIYISQLLVAVYFRSFLIARSRSIDRYECPAFVVDSIVRFFARRVRRDNFTFLM